jgi:YesN/AraC family two-component response regulator
VLDMLTQEHHTDTMAPNVGLLGTSEIRDRQWNKERVLIPKRRRSMRIYVKNMVSNRCKTAVEEALNELNIRHLKVELGYVDVEHIDDEVWRTLNEKLKSRGLELIKDHSMILVEKIKNIIIELVHYSDHWPTINLSTYLSQKLFLDYNYMSNVFSTVTGTTIEQFTIRQKVERVKELLLCNEFSVTEIAYQMNYSSVAHLSNQFKKVTGYSPSSFKKMRAPERVALESIGA